MDRPLQPLTKVLLALWALVTIPGGLILFFYPAFANTVAWPEPLPTTPLFQAQTFGAVGVGTGLASVIALRLNRWSSAFPVIGVYVGYAVFAELTALGLILAGQVPLQIWFYFLLGIFYLVASFIVWRQQGSATGS